MKHLQEELRRWKSIAILNLLAGMIIGFTCGIFTVTIGY